MLIIKILPLVYALYCITECGKHEFVTFVGVAYSVTAVPYIKLNIADGAASPVIRRKIRKFSFRIFIVENFVLRTYVNI